MKVKLLNDWKDKTVGESIGDYCGEQYDYPSKEDREAFALNAIDGAEWLFGSYAYENYSGDAFVLFKKDGKIFENGGGHCSCYGIEGQWNPEETTLEAVKHRLDQGSLGKCDWTGNEFADELRAFISEIEQ